MCQPARLTCSQKPRQHGPAVVCRPSRGSRARKAQKVTPEYLISLVGIGPPPSTARVDFASLFRQGVSTLKSERAHFLRSLSLARACGGWREHEAGEKRPSRPRRRADTHGANARREQEQRARSIDRGRARDHRVTYWTAATMAWGQNAWATEVEEEEEQEQQSQEQETQEEDTGPKPYVPPTRSLDSGTNFRPGATPNVEDESLFPSLGDAANVVVTKKEKKKKQVSRRRHHHPRPSPPPRRTSFASLSFANTSYPPSPELRV